MRFTRRAALRIIMTVRNWQTSPGIGSNPWPTQLILYLQLRTDREITAIWTQKVLEFHSFQGTRTKRQFHVLHYQADDEYTRLTPPPTLYTIFSRTAAPIFYHDHMRKQNFQAYYRVGEEKRLVCNQVSQENNQYTMPRSID